MSYEDGWAAIHLEMPKRVPRTEYSVESHWPLVRRVTGVEVGPESPAEVRRRASVEFMRAWNFDFFWSTLIGGDQFGQRRAFMGHAVYADGGGDRSDRVSCPFQDVDEVLNFDFLAEYGPRDPAEWKRRFEEHYRRQCAERPFGVNVTGTYVTLLSGFIDIFGWDMLLTAAGADPQAFGALANRYAQWMMPFYEALAEAEVPVVMIHDDIVWASGPFLNPAWYREFVFPNYRRYFRPLLDAGKKMIYTSDGDYSMFLDDIAACGVHGFVMEPMTDMAYIAEKYGRTHVFIGNADTRILLYGTKPAIRAEVERCMAIGKKCPGFFMAVGNHIPANTPVENALYYNEVYAELSVR